MKHVTAIWSPILGYSLYQSSSIQQLRHPIHNSSSVSIHSISKPLPVQKNPPFYHYSRFIIILYLSPTLQPNNFQKGIQYSLFPLSHLHSLFLMFSQLLPPPFLKLPLPRSTMTILLLNPIDKYLSISTYQPFQQHLALYTTAFFLSLSAIGQRASLPPGFPATSTAAPFQLPLLLLPIPSWVQPHKGSVLYPLGDHKHSLPCLY